MITTAFVFMRDGKFYNFKTGILHKDPLKASIYTTRVEAEKRYRSDIGWDDGVSYRRHKVFDLFELKEAFFHLIDVRKL